jgi:hypothetical protein
MYIYVYTPTQHKRLSHVDQSPPCRPMERSCDEGMKREHVNARAVCLSVSVCICLCVVSCVCVSGVRLWSWPWVRASMCLCGVFVVVCFVAVRVLVRAHSLCVCLSACIILCLDVSQLAQPHKILKSNSQNIPSCLKLEPPMG